MAARLGPLEINPRTNEPFLRLRKHQNVIITPYRASDIPLVIPPLNDERVSHWLSGTIPLPYLPEHAEEFIGKVKQSCDAGLKELWDAKETNSPIVLSDVPVRVIRELQEDGSDIFLGDIGFNRCTTVDDLLENPKYDSAANKALPAGHPDIIWTIGDYLVPSHHGKGIMTDAVDTVINDLARPYLGARHIVVTSFFGNEPSNKVFLKNGFTLTRQLVDFVTVRGVKHGLNVFERHYEAE